MVFAQSFALAEVSWTRLVHAHNGVNFFAKECAEVAIGTEVAICQQYIAGIQELKEPRKEVVFMGKEGVGDRLQQVLR